MNRLRSVQRRVVQYIRESALRADMAWSTTKRWLALAGAVGALVAGVWLRPKGYPSAADVGFEIALLLGIMLAGECLGHRYLARFIGVITIVVWLALLFAQQQAKLRLMQ